MEERARIKNKWHRVLYLPLALIQWSFLTVMMGGAGLLILTPIGIIGGLTSLMALNKEEAKICFFMAAAPFICTVMWWVDYVKKGEIGMYDN